MAVSKMKMISALVLLAIVSSISAYDELSKPTMDLDEMTTLIDILELEYEDQCSQLGDARWAALLDPAKSFEDKLEAEKDFGRLAKTQKSEINFEKVDSPIARKVKLISHPGDFVLETEKFNKLVSYQQHAEHALETATDYECGSKTCDFSEYLEFLASSRDKQLLESAKKSWEKKLPDDKKFKNEILPLLKEVSKDEGYVTVEEYWEKLDEFDDAYIKSSHLWTNIESLYADLQKYVALRLNKKDETLPKEGPIPSYLLGSQFGEDWLNIADVVLPNLQIYNEINKNLQNKHIGGKSAFRVASRMLHTIGLKDLKEKFFERSEFNKKSCPVKMINFCKSGIQAYTCNQTGLSKFLDAHDAAMIVKHSELKSSLSPNTYIYREANRYSALDEALSGLGSLIAMSPHHLNNIGVLPLKVFNSQRNGNADNKIMLKLLMALRDLPKLAYYYAADRWRVELVDYRIPSVWTDRRQNLTHVIPSDKEYLGDSYILSNKPYIGKFLGIILKYQLLEDLLGSDYQEGEDIVEYISEDHSKMREWMQKGYSQDWPTIISPIDIDSHAFLNYFQPLHEFLSAELNPNHSTNNYDDNIDNKIDDEEDANDDDLLDNFDSDNDEDNKVPESEVITEKQKHDTNEKPFSSENDFEDHVVQESVDNNPYLIPKDLDGGSPAASSSDLSNKKENQPGEIDAAALQYVWIGLGVLALVIIILGIIIAKKRYNHKKELERERREGRA